MRLTKKGNEWQWGSKNCKKCGTEFQKRSPRNDYCFKCVKIRHKERTKAYQEYAGMQVLSDLECMRRVVAVRATKAAGFDTLDMLDVLDGLKKPEQYSYEFQSFYRDVRKQMSEVVLKQRGQKDQVASKAGRTLRISKRQAPVISHEEVLVILIHDDLDREVIRMVGDTVVDYEISEEDLTNRMVMLNVDYTTWTTEPTVMRDRRAR